MVDVIAVERGYWDGVVRYEGDSFALPDDVWGDKVRRPRWVRLAKAEPFGGKGDHDGNGKAGGSKPAEKSGDLDDLRAEYEKVIGKRPFMGWDADTLRKKIAEAGGSKPAEPVTASNEVNDATGGTAPDWLPPQG